MRPIEQLRQVGQHVGDLIPAVVEVGQEVGGGGQEHVLDIPHYQLSGLTATLRYLVELQCPVVGDKANLGPPVPGQLVQLLTQRVAHTAQVAGLQGLPGHVQQEEIDGGLGRPEHVLLGSDELYRAGLALRPSAGVAVRLADGVVEKFLGQLVHSESDCW